MKDKEKKLTDEEIVKALECCTKSRCDDEATGDCPLKRNEYCSTLIAINALDFIHRLNAKYRNLEINYDAVYEDYRKYEIENKELQKQVEELKERLAVWDYKSSKIDVRRTGDYFILDGKMILIDYELFHEKIEKVRETYRSKARQERKETAREIFAKLQGYYHPPSNTIIIDTDEFYKLAKQYDVE